MAGGNHDFHFRQLAREGINGGKAFADAVRVRRQAKIGHRDGRLFLLRQRQRLRTVMGEQQIVFRECPAILAAQALVILNDQHFRLTHPHPIGVPSPQPEVYRLAY